MHNVAFVILQRRGSISLAPLIIISRQLFSPLFDITHAQVAFRKLTESWVNSHWKAFQQISVWKWMNFINVMHLIASPSPHCLHFSTFIEIFSTGTSKGSGKKKYCNVEQLVLPSRRLLWINWNQGGQRTFQIIAAQSTMSVSKRS